MVGVFLVGVVAAEDRDVDDSVEAGDTIAMAL